MDAVPDGLEARLRWLFGGVAVVLVATGAFALLVTSTAQPVQTSLATQAATDSQLRALVLATLAGFVAAMASLGARIVWSPRRSTHLMPVLVLTTLAASACASTTAVQAWRAGATWIEPATVGATSLVLAVASALGWLVLWLAERPGVATARRDEALFDALLVTLVPPGEGLDLDARDPDVRRRIIAAFAARSTRRRPALRIALRTLDARMLVKHRRRFDGADQELRERVVADLATSRRPRLRALGATLNEIVLGAFWSDARVRGVVGDDGARIAALLDVGPNAAAHRARREAAEAAARDAELAAAGGAQDDASGDAGDGSVVEPEVDGGTVVAPLVSDATTGTGTDDAATGADTADVARRAADVARAPLAGADLARTRPGGGELEVTLLAGAELAVTPVAVVAPHVAPASSGKDDAPSPAKPAGDGPREIAAQTDELPFDRAWTIGVPAQEAEPRPAIGPVLRVARTGGPTRR